MRLAGMVAGEHRFECNKCNLSFDMTPNIRSEYYCPYCGHKMNDNIKYEKLWNELFERLAKCNNLTTSWDIYHAMEIRDLSTIVPK